MNKSDNESDSRRIRPSLSNILHPQEPRAQDHRDPPRPYPPIHLRPLGRAGYEEDTPQPIGQTLPSLSPGLLNRPYSSSDDPRSSHLHTSTSPIPHGPPIRSDPFYYASRYSGGTPPTVTSRADESSNRWSYYQLSSASASAEHQSTSHQVEPSSSLHPFIERQSGYRTNTNYPRERDPYVQESLSFPPQPIASGSGIHSIQPLQPYYSLGGDQFPPDVPNLPSFHGHPPLRQESQAFRPLNVPPPRWPHPHDMASIERAGYSYQEIPFPGAFPPVPPPIGPEEQDDSMEPTRSGPPRKRRLVADERTVDTVKIEPSEPEIEYEPRRTTSGKAHIACDFCRGRKLRCDQKRPSCSNCLARPGQACHYQPTVRRRGPGRKNQRGKKKSTGASSSSREASSSIGVAESIGQAGTSASGGSYGFSRPESPVAGVDTPSTYQQPRASGSQSQGIGGLQQETWHYQQHVGRGQSSTERRREHEGDRQYGRRDSRENSSELEPESPGESRQYSSRD